MNRTPESITPTNAVQQWSWTAVYNIMALILCSVGLAWAEPYDILVKQPALWDADRP